MSYNSFMKSGSLIQIKVLCAVLGFCSGLMLAMVAVYIMLIVMVGSLNAILGPDGMTRHGGTIFLLLGPGLAVGVLVLAVFACWGWNFGPSLKAALDANWAGHAATGKKFLILIIMVAISVVVTGALSAFLFYSST